MRESCTAAGASLGCCVLAPARPPNTRPLPHPAHLMPPSAAASVPCARVPHRPSSWSAPATCSFTQQPHLLHGSRGVGRRGRQQPRLRPIACALHALPPQHNRVPCLPALPAADSPHPAAHKFTTVPLKGSQVMPVQEHSGTGLTQPLIPLLTEYAGQLATPSRCASRRSAAEAAGRQEARCAAAGGRGRGGGGRERACGSGGRRRRWRSDKLLAIVVQLAARKAQG